MDTKFRKKLWGSDPNLKCTFKINTCIVIKNSLSCMKQNTNYWLCRKVFNEFHNKEQIGEMDQGFKWYHQKSLSLSSFRFLHEETNVMGILLC